MPPKSKKQKIEKSVSNTDVNCHNNEKTNPNHSRLEPKTLYHGGNVNHLEYPNDSRRELILRLERKHHEDKSTSENVTQDHEKAMHLSNTTQAKMDILSNVIEIFNTTIFSDFSENTSLYADRNYLQKMDDWLALKTNIDAIKEHSSGNINLDEAEINATYDDIKTTAGAIKRDYERRDIDVPLLITKITSEFENIDNMNEIYSMGFTSQDVTIITGLSSSSNKERSSNRQEQDEAILLISSDKSGQNTDTILENEEDSTLDSHTISVSDYADFLHKNIKNEIFNDSRTLNTLILGVQKKDKVRSKMWGELQEHVFDLNKHNSGKKVLSPDDLYTVYLGIKEVVSIINNESSKYWVSPIITKMKAEFERIDAEYEEKLRKEKVQSLEHTETSIHAGDP